MKQPAFVENHFKMSKMLRLKFCLVVFSLTSGITLGIQTVSDGNQAKNGKVLNQLHVKYSDPSIDTGYSANAQFKPLGQRLEKYAQDKGFDSMYEYCCQIQADGCGTKDGLPCDPECEQAVQNRIRYLSSDVGFYLKFDFDGQGLPTG